MKLLILGNHTCGNRGDSAILRGLLDAINILNPHAEVDVMSRYPVSSSWLLNRPVMGDPLFLRYGRVKAEDRLGEAIGCDVVLMLVGERPGLGQSESMSCYGVYRPTAATLESDRSVISNIHREGTPPVEAAAVIVDLVRQMMQHKASGIALNKALNPGFSG